jgi:hypothetical protein
MDTHMNFAVFAEYRREMTVVRQKKSKSMDGQPGTGVLGSININFLEEASLNINTLQQMHALQRVPNNSAQPADGRVSGKFMAVKCLLKIRSWCDPFFLKSFSPNKLRILKFTTLKLETVSFQVNILHKSRHAACRVAARLPSRGKTYGRIFRAKFF